MTIEIQPVNDDAGVLGMPNGFWPAFCVETPVAKIIDCHYKHADRSVIVYEHDGYVGEWFSEAEALEMHRLLVEYVKTEGFMNHRYFSERKSQMNSMLEFLPQCGGFRMNH
ncbi:MULTISPECIES: hypothetical protein [unclassified Halomonas]|uniref:hypothetical protein n=1 Tax=unclassified Halomonas TaxID=2609666 RepID=UPI002076AA5F|nr:MULTISPECIES: hypothetical protein [unclassified Halomonas]